MRAVCLNEFISLLKHQVDYCHYYYVWVSYKTAGLIEQAPADVVRELDLGSDAGAIGTAVIVFALGFLFIAGLSHDMINREVHTRTVRFLVTKRRGSRSFWESFLASGCLVFCMLVSYALVMIASKSFMAELCRQHGFLTAAISLNLYFDRDFKARRVNVFGIVFALVFQRSVYGLFIQRTA
ncbi:hypothetical protein PO124_11270 [Bacillus licheniformis]|nr:hypothetical protein [Bacillus licheniformis]